MHEGPSTEPSPRHPPEIPAQRMLPLGRPELKLAIFYVILASTWVTGSDLVFVRMLNIPVESIIIHTFKGLNIAATTGVLFYIVLRRAYGGWRRSETARTAELEASNTRFRNLSSHIQTLRENERASISREVHDELGQLLTGIKLKVRMVENRLDERDDLTLNPQIEDLVEAGEMIDQTIHSVRRISSGLRPSTLDHLGLATALHAEAEQFTDRTGIECIAGIEDPLPDLEPVVQTTAFRVCQECLTNAARHSGATRVEIACSIRNGMLLLRVSDNGSGCPPEAPSAPHSLGMLGMRERAENLSGTLDVGSSPGAGTTVTLSVPIPTNRQPSLP